MSCHNLVMVIYDTVTNSTHFQLTSSVVSTSRLCMLKMWVSKAGKPRSLNSEEARASHAALSKFTPMLCAYVVMYNLFFLLFSAVGSKFCQQKTSKLFLSKLISVSRVHVVAKSSTTTRPLRCY